MTTRRSAPTPTPGADAAATIAPRIRQRMSALGITQAELARRAGVRKEHLNQVLNRLGDGITVKTLAPLARALGVPLTWLATGDGPVDLDAVPCAHRAAGDVPGWAPAVAGLRATQPWIPDAVLAAAAQVTGLDPGRATPAFVAGLVGVVQLTRALATPVDATDARTAPAPPPAPWAALEARLAALRDELANVEAQVAAARRRAVPPAGAAARARSGSPTATGGQRSTRDRL